MRLRCLSAYVTTLGWLTIPLLANAQPPETQIFLIGTEWTYQTPKNVEGPWLALYHDKYETYPTALEEVKVGLQSMPESAEDKEREAVLLEEPKQYFQKPFLLIRNENLKPGRVETAIVKSESNDQTQLQPVFYTAMLYDKQYSVNLNLSEDQTDGSLTIQGEDGPVQVLQSTDASENPTDGPLLLGQDQKMSHIIWMGDLDRDKKLDFVLDGGGKGGGYYSLYLSTYAKDGQIAGKVAEIASEDHKS
jgi:hypothetical protein